MISNKTALMRGIKSGYDQAKATTTGTFQVKGSIVKSLSPSIDE
jgi:hypothetical protein